MHTSIRHYSLTVEREALATRRRRPDVDAAVAQRATRRTRGPSLRERIHDALQGATRPAGAAGATA
jgi:hypothetical protein